MARNDFCCRGIKIWNELCVYDKKLVLYAKFNWRTEKTWIKFSVHFPPTGNANVRCKMNVIPSENSKIVAWRIENIHVPINVCYLYLRQYNSYATTIHVCIEAQKPIILVEKIVSDCSNNCLETRNEKMVGILIGLTRLWPAVELRPKRLLEASNSRFKTCFACSRNCQFRNLVK